MVSEGLRLRGNIAEPVEGEAADNDRDAGGGRGAGADERITGMSAVLCSLELRLWPIFCAASSACCIIHSQCARLQPSERGLRAYVSCSCEGVDPIGADGSQI